VHIRIPFSRWIGSWQGHGIQDIVQTLAVDCVSNLIWPNDDGRSGAGSASKEIVFGAVQAICKFSLLVSQQNDSKLAINAQDDTHNQIYSIMSAVYEHKMGKSAIARVGKYFAGKLNQS